MLKTYRTTTATTGTNKKESVDNKNKFAVC